MGQKKHPIDLVLSKFASAGSNDVAMNPTEDGRLTCIQHVAVENETTDCTDVRILKAGVGRELHLAEEDTPLAGVLYWSDDDVYLQAGQYVLARFTGCTADDVLKVYITGYWTELGEGG